MSSRSQVHLEEPRLLDPGKSAEAPIKTQVMNRRRRRVAAGRDDFVMSAPGHGVRRGAPLVGLEWFMQRNRIIDRPFEYDGPHSRKSAGSRGVPAQPPGA